MSFRRTTITIVVLSEDSIADRELGDILEACDTGDCVLADTDQTEVGLTGAEMAKALTAAGSDPGFFMLDETVKITVDWSVDDDDDVTLPETVDVPQDVYDQGYQDEDAVADWLSDKYGYLVNGWKVAADYA